MTSATDQRHHRLVAHYGNRFDPATLRYVVESPLVRVSEWMPSADENDMVIVEVPGPTTPPTTQPS